MDSLPYVPPSIALPHTTPLSHHHRRFRLSFLQSSLRHNNHVGVYGLRYSQRPCREKSCMKIWSKSKEGEGEEDEEVERALHMDGTIPGTSNEFVKQVSSRAYDMRRNLQQTFDSSSYDVLEANPWRESSKPVYVLTQRENQLCTMKTRQTRSEVERELGQLFSRGRKTQNTSKQSGNGMKFQMLVEDVREGILVFEDIDEAAKYCDLLGGQNCEGVAEIEASSVFDLCNKMKALAVLFRRGRTPPLPESLKQNLRARKRSLEDQEDV
ncbi:hypothetical protein LIER_22137 [Lithospermum erythrorhizon]|uniref:Uncharacterized protein n=1 Tax=Lithospermum erythrorhizon TaxID=34254 RepID=A0AAV3QSP6_LITER